jgi:uncharacterized protein (TIGR00251 family)
MLTAHPEGVVVDTWVVPGASRDGVVGVHGDAVKVTTAAPPEDGRANRAVARLIAEAFGGSGGDVIGGHTARRKRVLVRGIEMAAARRFVSALDDRG